MPLNRRTFIAETCIAGAVILGAGSLIGGCSGIRRADIGSESYDGKIPSSITKEGAEILRLASLAPSGHNSQPWIVRPKKEWEWTIGADPERRLPAVDPQNREGMLSLGAFVENLVTAAGAMGYETDVEVIGEKRDDRDLVRVSLKKGKPSGYPVERIEKRRTVKSGHLPDELKKSDVQALEKAEPDRLFYFPRSSEHAKCIAGGAVESFREQSYRDDAQSELAEWIRFGNDEARKHLDGLTPESMEIKGFAGLYVRYFMGKGDVMKKSFREQGIKKLEKQAKEGAGWIIITSGGDGAADLIDTGRRFERLFLTLRERNIAIHPMTQMLEEEKWRKEIDAQHDPGMIPQFILRVGYLERYPDPVSLRRPVHRFVKA